MEKNLTLGSASLGGLQLDATRKPSATDKAVEWFSRYYSDVLGRSVGRSETMLMLRTQLALVLTVMPVYSSPALHLAAAAWLAVCAVRCFKTFR